MEVDQQLEQRINIKFLVKMGKNGPETHQMLQQIYGDYALNFFLSPFYCTASLITDSK